MPVDKIYVSKPAYEIGRHVIGAGRSLKDQSFFGVFYGYVESASWIRGMWWYFLKDVAHGFGVAFPENTLHALEDSETKGFPFDASLFKTK